MHSAQIGIKNDSITDSESLEGRAEICLSKRVSSLALVSSSGSWSAVGEVGIGGDPGDVSPTRLLTSDAVPAPSDAGRANLSRRLAQPPPLQPGPHAALLGHSEDNE